MAFRVFISHSTRDAGILDALIEFVKHQGAETQVAELLISPGEGLQEKVKDMISKSDIVIAVLTKNGTRSKWVDWEIGAAFGMGKTVVPLLEEGVEEPPHLKGKEHITFSLAKIQVTFNSLSEFIQKRIGVKTRKLAGTIAIIAGVAAIAIGLILLLYETKEDKQIIAEQ